MLKERLGFIIEIKRFIKNNKLFVVILLLLVLILIPIFTNDIYAHPVGDDYYGANEINSLTSGDLTKIFSAGIDRAINTYKTWQGNYFTTFLGIFNPLIYSIKLYSLFIFIAQLFYIFSVMFLFLSLPKIKGIVSKKQAAGLGIIYMILSLLFMYSAGEGIYWYPSIMMYLLSYSFSMLFFGLIIRHIVSKKKYLYWLIVLFTLCLAGTSYVTCVFVWFVLLLLLIVSFFKDRKTFWLYLPIFLLFSVGFAANVLAPGNFARKSEVTQNVSAIQAIWMTIPSAINMIWKTLFRTMLVPVLVLLTPISIKVIKQIKYKFNHPIVSTLALFIVFAMLFAPCTYAYGAMYQPPRVENIQLFYLLILLPSIYFYWLGSILRNIKVNKISRDLEVSCYMIGAMSIFLMVAAIGTDGITVKSITADLLYSKSTTYDACMDTTETLLTNPDELEVTIMNCTPTDNMFNFSIKTDDWAALSMEKYFNKNITVGVDSE